jgi:putative chitinase
MSDYKISVKNPKSDNENKIGGTLYLKTETRKSQDTKVDRFYWITEARLNNLPNPFINPITNLPVLNSEIYVKSETENISDNSIDESDVLNTSLTDLQAIFSYRYGIVIDLKYDIVQPNDTGTTTVSTDTEIIGTSSNTTPTNSVIITTKSVPREYTFDVQMENTFYNSEIGYLTITSKAEDTFVYGDEEDTIDPEYIEEPFVGEEEELIKLEEIDVSALNDIKGFDPENPDPAISTDAGSPYPIPKNKQANISAIVAAMNRKKITNKFTQAAILAVVSKETAFVPRNEGSYVKTSAGRIKSIFKAMRKYSDDEVDRIKKIPKQFFDIIYGSKYGNSSDEGYKYRGRGFNQLTFKDAYKSMQKKTGHKIVEDPDLLNTIDVASDCIVAYFLERMGHMPNKFKTQYNTSGINDFKTLNDALGAIYHANAGWGNSYSLLVADSTGGRRKAFLVGPSLYKNLA